MKKTLKTFTDIIKRNVVTLFLFEFIFTISMALIFLPVVINAIKLSFERTGITFITSGNIAKLIVNPVMISVLTVSFLGCIFLLFYEICCITACFEQSVNAKKISVRTMLTLGYIKAKLMLRHYRIKNFFVLIGLFPLYHFFLMLILYWKIEIVRVAVKHYFKGNELVVAVSAVIAVSVIISAAIICRTGSRMIRNGVSEHWGKIKIIRFLHAVLCVVLINAVLAVALYAMYMISVFGAAVVLRFFGQKRSAFVSLIKFEKNIYLLIAFFACVFSKIFNTAMIYSFCYGCFGKGTIRNLHITKFTFKISSKIRFTVFTMVAVVLAADFYTAVKYFINGSQFMEEMIISTTVTAHRGGAQFAPENTMDAIRYSIENGADYVEIDVQLTKDGTVILLHDDNLRRTTGYNGFAYKMNYEDIRKLDAGSHYSASFSDAYVPTFEEVLNECKGKINLNIELKKTGKTKYELVDKVLELIDNYEMTGQCVITSTTYSYLRYVKQKSPQLRTGLISNSFFGDPATLEFADFLSVKHTIVTKSFVRSAHSAGKDVHVWTVNTKHLINRMKGLEVDSIITDNPVLCQKVLSRKNDRKSFSELFQTLLNR